MLYWAGEMSSRSGSDPKWLTLLMGSAPEIIAIRDAHVGYYDEVIPHVLMGEIAQWVQRMWVEGQTDVVRRVIDSLESGYESLSDRERNVVDVSFVENLPLPSEPGAGLAALLGPLLAPGYRAVNHLSDLDRPGPSAS